MAESCASRPIQADLFTWTTDGETKAAAQDPILDTTPVAADQPTEALIRKLSSGEPSTGSRLAIIAELGHRRATEAVPSLLTVLRLEATFDLGSRRSIAAAALRSLSEIGDRSAGTLVDELLCRGDYALPTVAQGLALFEALRHRPSDRLLARCLALDDAAILTGAAGLIGDFDLLRFQSALQAVAETHAPLRPDMRVALGQLGCGPKEPLEAMLPGAGGTLLRRLCDALAVLGDADTLVHLRRKVAACDGPDRKLVTACIADLTEVDGAESHNRQSLKEPKKMS